jgi:uncharacterized coiled-coil protein SlyX
MTNHQDRINEGVIDALEAANKRIEQLEGQLAQQQALQEAQSMTPEQRAETERQAEAETLLDAIKKAQNKNTFNTRIQ